MAQPPYSAIYATLIGCSTARNKGTCDNRVNIRRDELESRVLNALRTRLVDPALFARFCEVFTQEVNRLRMDSRASINAAQAEVEKIDREEKKLMDLYLKDALSVDAVKERGDQLKARKAELTAFLATADEACETVSTVAPQLRPSCAGDVDAVAPVPLRDRQAAVSTGGRDGAAIKAGVLINGRAFQRIPQDRQHLGKGRGALHRAGTDSMQIGEHPALHLRIDIGYPGLDGIVGTHAGDTDLADAATAVVRRLDVQSKEAERALGERRDTRLPDESGLRCWRRYRSNLRGKEAQALPFDGRLFVGTPAKAAQRSLNQIDRLVIGLHPAPVPGDGVVGREGENLGLQPGDIRRVGHGRVLAATMLGLTEVPVIRLSHLDEAERRVYRIADNKLTELGEWDEALLRDEIAGLLAEDFDLTLLDISDDDLDALLRDPEALGGDGSVEGEDDVPELPVTPVSVPGDLWNLGGHRLICGDSTAADVVGRLLGDVRPLLMVTDPPYGVEYDPSWRNQAGAAKTKRTGKVLNDDRADWREAWALFPGDVAYVWHGALHAATVADSLVAAGFAIRSQIIWAKDRLVLSRGDYHWQHEPCWYAVRAKGKGHWAGDRKQTTLWQIANRGQDADTVHGTQKPVECMRRPILNNSSPGQAVFEPFMGSGTTLIAAETTGRVCFGIELNPAYVDVAIERWQQFTGANAVLADTGETFADLKAKRLTA
ncbi:DNA modification methylase [Phaeovulum vinaykumarii]|uniref:site-specific DNA-methyltransferase (adenine-specific) n=1 Tax=Phaeovulum vinaykumarii TaxID=407234 RepID=A0A1N7N1G9_9RHOB|nr:DNA modification methylase [Phaeovulum vinaykumarii]SOC17897.1 DNA modification methylase [Phaeovulum vinaykumarii]